MLSLRVLVVASLMFGAGCEPSTSESARVSANGHAWTFTNVAESAGLVFEHEAAQGNFFIIEEMGPGGAFFDADGDGDLDAYLVQGGRVFGTPTGELAPNRFFRNVGDGRFRDETQVSGAGDTGYGIGCVVADYDNDGDRDIFVTNTGPDVLLQNDGSGRFTDVTQRAGVGDAGLCTSAAFLDYDADGLLDLYVCVYVPWTADIEGPCYDPRGERDYCHPSEYPPGQDRLYHNQGDGTFKDVTATAGLDGWPAYGLGVVGADFDGDGHQDVYVANDGVPNYLWLNQGDGTFREVATERGCAYNGNGQPEASMGIVCEDLDSDGDLDLLLTHLHRQTNTYYRNDAGYFTDVTDATGLGRIGVTETSFGVGAIDVDNDGESELFLANGSVMRKTDPPRADLPYAERNLLLRPGGPGGQLEDITARAGPGLDLVAMSRGAVFGDYDDDGDVDILVCNNRGPAHLLRNDTTSDNGWVAIAAVGTSCNRDALGALVTVDAGQRSWRRPIAPSYSYASSNDHRVHVGVGTASIVTVSIDWPGGGREVWRDLPAGQVHRLEQGSGVGVTQPRVAGGVSDPAGDVSGTVAPPPAFDIPAINTSDLDYLAQRIGELASARHFDAAIPLAQEWVALVRARAGYKHPHMMQATTTLAQLYRAVGDHVSAERITREALADARSEVGPDHPSVGRFSSDLGKLLLARGELEEAEYMFRETTRVCEANFGNANRQVAVALIDVGRVCTNRGRWLDVVQALERAATIERAVGAADAYTATIFNDLGLAYGHLNDHVRSAKSHATALEIRTALHGSGHADTAVSYSQLGTAFRRQGRLDEAEAHIRRALATFQRMPGADPMYLATTKRDLATLLVDRQAYREAETLYAAALPIFEQTFGPAHESTTQLRENLGKVRRALSE